MSKRIITILEEAIEFYLKSLIRKVVEEVNAERRDAWADRERAEHCGL